MSGLALDDPPVARKPKRNIGCIVSTIVLIVILGGITAFIFALPALIALPYNSALSRWQSQGITHYEMVVTDNREIEICHWLIEVQDGEVVNETDLATNSFNCASAPTVDELFERIVDYSERGCGPGGCGCDGPWTVTVHYDAQYGFPAYIHPTRDTSTRFLYVESWVPQPCIVAELLPHEITVSGFTPLP